MGNSLSVNYCATQDQPVSCDLPGPGEFGPNGDVAGIGVVYSFIASVFATLIVAALILLSEGYDLFAATFGGNYERLERRRRAPQESFRQVLEAVVLSLSDQQFITGISLMIITLFQMGCSVSAYHYDIICELVIMSTITHMASLLVIGGYFRNILLGPARFLLVVITLGLGFRMFLNRSNASFPTQVPGNDTMLAPSILLPIPCFISENGTDLASLIGTDQGGTYSFSGFARYIIVFFFSVCAFVLAPVHAVFTAPHRNDAHLTHRQWTFVFRIVALIAAIVIAYLSLRKVLDLRSWMKGSEWPEDMSEYEWNSFGQALPMLLLVLTPLAFLETLADTLKEKGIIGQTGQMDKRVD